MWKLINLLGAHTQLDMSHFPVASPACVDSEGPGLSCWLWVPAVPLAWAGTYPAESDLSQAMQILHSHPVKWQESIFTCV